MDRFSEKQAQIARHRDELIARYPALWQNIITEWKSPGPDQAWLTYSANYLFRTGNVRWALDPLTLNWRLKDSAPKVDVSDLGDASFILLTHRHEDHLDLDLLAALRHFPICWVVPEPILVQVTGQAGIPRENIIVPRPLHPIEQDGIRITPFDGLHWATESDGTLRGVPSTGYLVEWAGRRWLFPGDTRTYDVSQLPDFGPLNGLFAHLWLGRGSALLDGPPMLDSFCRFFADLQPGRILLTHLMEFGREVDDYWDVSHAQMVTSHFQKHLSHIKISHALIGQKVLL
jgi:hypothetical protein